MINGRNVSNSTHYNKLRQSKAKTTKTPPSHHHNNNRNQNHTERERSVGRRRDRTEARSKVRSARCDRQTGAREIDRRGAIVGLELARLSGASKPNPKPRANQTHGGAATARRHSSLRDLRRSSSSSSRRCSSLARRRRLQIGLTVSAAPVLNLKLYLIRCFCLLVSDSVCVGLAFRGHDESQGSSDKGNFLELVQFLGDHNESINEVLQKAPKNCKLTHPDVQKDIVNAIARETSKAIIKDLDNGFFSILVDESRDISVKEQMDLVLRYVNKEGIIIERFLGIVHIASTTALSLKHAIECLLCEHNLSLSNLRGQGYDGASNMQGDINGLKTLILKENKSAFYVHYFAHQLQLTLVAVAKNHINIAEFFYVVSNLVTVVEGSCKRRDALRDTQFAKIKEDLENGVRRSGQGLNQETNLKRPSDTRWGSYYGTILSLILMFSTVVDVLEIIEEDGLSDQKVEARSIMSDGR
uniref:DUF4371 domain-containing protein n=1 Tax=Quercus lobata TaxID=97700 RepID=A0A7N2N1H1_QUELO